MLFTRDIKVFSKSFLSLAPAMMRLQACRPQMARIAVACTRRCQSDSLPEKPQSTGCGPHSTSFGRETVRIIQYRLSGKFSNLPAEQSDFPHAFRSSSRHRVDNQLIY